MKHEPELRRLLALYEYELALQEAETDLLRFCEMTMPDPRKPDDPHSSKYKAARHHKMMADLMMQVERGEKRKIIMNLPPRHGKTELCTKRFAAWYSALHPEEDIIIATYNEKFAADFALEVRAIIASARFRQIFPDYFLTEQSSDRVVTYMGGKIYFLGRRSSTTGRGANCIIVDDPTKDDKEIRYPLFREDCWQWFTQTLLTRRHNDRAAIVVSQCMTGDTPVLRPDGTETPLRDLKVGDSIATYDNGKLSASVLLGYRNCGADDTFKIRMTSGATVRANARHPFLVERGGRLEWVRLRNMRRGDAIVRVNGASGRTSVASGTGATARSGFVATATPTTISGDGPLDTALRPQRRTASRVLLESSSIAMASQLMTMSACWLNKVAGALYARAILPKLATPSTGQMFCALTIATTPARFGGFCAMTAISPLVEGSHQKHSKKWLHTSDFTLDVVAEISADAREDVYDIQVSRTENFIANGLVSHNTRWHEDDIVGRIIDKSNPAYSERLAREFEIINLPAIAEVDDPLQRKPGEALWPERFGLDYLEEMRAANALSFSALYQCDPTPEDGVFFRPEELHEYEIGQMPDALTYYVASDHAVSTASNNDPSCLVPFGVCPNGIAWIMPDVIWRRMDAKEAVGEMIDLIRRRHPVFWYAERGHISRAIGPFLRDAMEREGVYCPIIEDHPVVDKLQRAQSGRAKCSQGRIRFPKWAPWWPRAKSELLKFPNGRFDDFVDVISTIGNKIGTHAGPSRIIVQSKAQPGTFGYMLKEFRMQDIRDDGDRSRSGW